MTAHTEYLWTAATAAAARLQAARMATATGHPANVYKGPRCYFVQCHADASGIAPAARFSETVTPAQAQLIIADQERGAGLIRATGKPSGTSFDPSDLDTKSQREGK